MARISQKGIPSEIYFFLNKGFVPFRVTEKSGKGYDGSMTLGGRGVRHFRSSSVPTPLAMESLLHFTASASIKPALQQAAEDGTGSGALSSPRKQPPPKPKRDPNTRLSASYEAVSAGLTLAAKESPTPEGFNSPAGSPPKAQLSPTDPGRETSSTLNYYFSMQYSPVCCSAKIVITFSLYCLFGINAIKCITL